MAAGEVSCAAPPARELSAWTNGEPGAVGGLLGAITSAVLRLGAQWKARVEPRRLRIAETVSLGDKRFVAILEADGERLLIAGTPGQVMLLRSLRPLPDPALSVAGADGAVNIGPHVQTGACPEQQAREYSE